LELTEVTRRDYFAAMALHGLLANPKLAEEIKKRQGWIDESAWQWADKVLELREKNLG
jgi:hypothetical protein